MRFKFTEREDPIEVEAYEDGTFGVVLRIDDMEDDEIAILLAQLAIELGSRAVIRRNEAKPKRSTS